MTIAELAEVVPDSIIKKQGSFLFGQLMKLVVAARETPLIENAPCSIHVNYVYDLWQVHRFNILLYIHK